MTQFEQEVLKVDETGTPVYFDRYSTAAQYDPCEDTTMEKFDAKINLFLGDCGEFAPAWTVLCEDFVLNENQDLVIKEESLSSRESTGLEKAPLI